MSETGTASLSETTTVFSGPSTSMSMPGDDEVLVERRVGLVVDDGAGAAAASPSNELVTMIPVARTSHSIVPSW